MWPFRNKSKELMDLEMAKALVTARMIMDIVELQKRVEKLEGKKKFRGVKK